MSVTPRLRDLLRVADEAPGTETDLTCALYPEAVQRTQRLLLEAERRGLVRWHYRRWWITESGKSELAILAATLTADGKEHTSSR